MKTNKLVIVAAVAFALTAVSQAKAGGVLLSPRAQGNQIVKFAGTYNDPDLVATLQSRNGILLSPRAQGNQIVRFAGTYNDPDLVTALQSHFGSPHSNWLQAAPVYQIAPIK